MKHFDEDLKPLYSMEYEFIESVYGPKRRSFYRYGLCQTWQLTLLFLPHPRCNYGQYLISRPDLYNILWRQIPRANIILGKKILAFQQSSKGVRIECSDNTAYHGDILVGADGAYSAVRQTMYKELKADKKLPRSDNTGLPFGCICLVGQTMPLNPNEFPALQSNICDFNSVLGSDSRCTVCVLNAHDTNISSQT